MRFALYDVVAEPPGNDREAPDAAAQDDDTAPSPAPPASPTEAGAENAAGRAQQRRRG